MVVFVNGQLGRLRRIGFCDQFGFGFPPVLSAFGFGQEPLELEPSLSLDSVPTAARALKRLAEQGRWRGGGPEWLAIPTLAL